MGRNQEPISEKTGFGLRSQKGTSNNHQCVTYPVPKVLQGTRMPVISPPSVRPGETQDESFDFLGYRRSSRRLPITRTIELPRHQFACHRRMVAGLTIVAIAWSALLPCCLPIVASSRRSSSFSLIRPVSFDRRIRFSVTRYSLRRRSSSSMVPVTLASSFLHDMQVLHAWWKYESRTTGD